jgi:glycosyltransferase involved in cell wall biosynthesis
MDFARRTLDWDKSSLSRLRRILRAFYRGFDGLFVLNTQMRAWLEGDQMGIPADRLHSTAHWPDPCFSPMPSRRRDLFPAVGPGERVLLYAGRISEEKGVLELPSLLQRLRERGIDARLAFAGAGPQEERLKELVPDGIFLGWCDSSRLASAYSSADLLVLPSRFDTFGCVVVEAMACGLPVAAYSVQGPRDIVQHGLSGILGDSLPELAQEIGEHLASPSRMEVLRSGALERAAHYRPDGILRRFVEDLGLGDEPLRIRRNVAPAGDPNGFLGELLELVQGL